MSQIIKHLFTSFDSGVTAEDENCLRTQLSGLNVLRNPAFNKGTAFSKEERYQLGLTGLIPSGVCTLEEQISRVYEQYSGLSSDIEKNTYLTALRNRNQVLFYKLFMSHISEMMPIVYDPTVGKAIEKYSQYYRRPEGIYLSIEEPDKIEESFRNFGLAEEDVDLIVATDAEEILGIGDWGIGGIDIAVGKLAVYTAVAGIHPQRAIPVMLDVGTNNESLLNDPLYMGYRHARVRGQQYDAFIEAYVKVVRKLYPKALLHWEDFGPGNGRRILLKYQQDFATFNDDMQGTGAITLAAILNALKVAGQKIVDMRIVIFGAGTAGVGIADQLRDAMIRHGLAASSATKQIWLVDKQGLLTEEMITQLRDYQQSYARSNEEIKHWKRSGPEKKITLADVVKQAGPTILIGTSTAPHTFTEEIVKEMAKNTHRPIILPLSNPTGLAEAVPADLIKWTNGLALVATGSPFPPVTWEGVTYQIGQANNALLYPGLGLGTIVAQASQINSGMLWAAAEAVANATHLGGKGESLLPAINRGVSAAVAVAVADAADAEGLCQAQLTNIVDEVKKAMWEPNYQTIKPEN